MQCPSDCGRPYVIDEGAKCLIAKQLVFGWSGWDDYALVCSLAYKFMLTNYFYLRV